MPMRVVVVVVGGVVVAVVVVLVVVVVRLSVRSFVRSPGPVPSRPVPFRPSVLSFVLSFVRFDAPALSVWQR